MRVILTELFFDGESAPKLAGKRRRHRFRRVPIRKEQVEGVAFAWFKSDGAIGEPRDLTNLKAFMLEELPRDQIERALGLIVSDVEHQPGWRIDLDEPIENPEHVKLILDTPIILEHSPPEAVKFLDILKRTNTPAMIGAYVGYHMAGDSPLLMILFVTGGIIVVSSAVGIGDALAEGLHKSIEQFFERPRRRRAVHRPLC